MATQLVSLADLALFCRQQISLFHSRQLILLNGPLGVGKTQFVKECVSQLGGELPESPTFSVINQYAGSNTILFHVDLYRMISESDIESTGFWDLFREEKAIFFVEWAEKIPLADWPRRWPCQQWNLQFTKDTQVREITTLSLWG